MQKSRRFALVVSLSAAIVLGAGMNGAPRQHRQHRAGALDDGGVVSSIIDYIVLASRILIPPG